jgi:HK97 family phage portal protein
VLAQSVASLSFGVFERTSSDERLSRRDHPFARLFRKPNRRDTTFEFVAAMVDDLAAEGGYLAERQFEADGSEVLWRIEPGHYLIELMGDRSRRFRIREPGRPERIRLDDEVWYIPLPPMMDALRGRSPIMDDGREQIGAALALQAYANSFFANDATPSTIFMHKGNFKDEASKANFLSGWSRWFGGRNRHKPAVLEFGMDVKQLGHTHEQAQFLETRQELNADIARLWRMPPHKVGILDKATFSNIEHQGLEFVTDTLAPYLRLIEDSIDRNFLDGAQGEEYFEFNVASLLRGDTKARFDAYAIARQWGWLSVNEIRALENRNGIGARGDRYMEPLNMTPVGVTPDQTRSTEKAIAFLRESVAANGGRPKLKVIRNAA